MATPLINDFKGVYEPLTDTPPQLQSNQKNNANYY